MSQVEAANEKPPNNNKRRLLLTGSFHSSSDASSISDTNRERMADDSEESQKSGQDSTIDATAEESNVSAFDVIPADLLGQLSNVTIEADTPAAEALRANAEVHVGKFSKLARGMNAQVLRKMVKAAAMRGKNGFVRGKPPRIPPNRSEDDMYVVEEEEEDEFEDGETDSVIAANEMLEQQQQKLPQPAQQPQPPQAAAGEKKDAPRLSLLDKAKDIPDEVVAATTETGRKVLEKVDPHDMIQHHRWRRRRKQKGDKKLKSYVKGKVIDGQHELYALSIAVMLGVRTSIAHTNGLLSPDRGGHRFVMDDDFLVMEKYEFPPSGGPKTPPHPLSHTFKFKDYAPIAFAYLRRMFGVNEYDFLLSVCGNANFIEFVSNAKSGQFFFYSSDGKYMIKTMTNAESKFLREILPDYFRHCASNPNSLITRIFGMYRVKLYHLRRNVKFVIMNSVYYTDKYLQTFYDLKGSSVGREAKPGQDVRKDNDLRRRLPEEALVMKPSVRERVREQLVKDTDFLRRVHIMDYSLLVGVHHIPCRKNDSIAKTGYKAGEIRDSTSAVRHSLGSKSSRRRRSTSDVQTENKRSTLAKTPSGSSVTESIGSYGSPSALGRHFERMSPDLKHGNFSNMVDYGLDDDDESSYLEGGGKAKQTIHPDSAEKAADFEEKKFQTIEKIYWPFHRLFDIHGYRNIAPVKCIHCNEESCTCPNDKSLLRQWKIPEFEKPLSDRKDKGFVMDKTGYTFPMTLRGSHGEQLLYEGKIFYMGIIDILQKYNTRKKFETSYRRFEHTHEEPSCVHPDDYARRFISFFDEYSRGPKIETGGDALDENIETVLVSSAGSADQSDGGEHLVAGGRKDEKSKT